MPMENQPIFESKMSKTARFFMSIKPSSCVVAIFGSMLLAFGLYNIHSISGVTEGGILGLVLLLEKLFNISPSITGLVLNTLCYILGWKTFGKKFIAYSAIATAGFSLSYDFFEQFPPVYPEIANMPALATVVGAIFVGVSAGLCVRIGGAPSGDDALAMSLSKLLKVDISVIYLFSDFIVLALSLIYIPVVKILYSVITVILSGQIIGIVVKIKLPKIKSKRKQKKDKKTDFLSGLLSYN